MAGGQKIVAVFVMWLVVLSVMHIEKGEAAGGSQVYKQCYETCQNDCMQGGRTYTDCEMKCDTDCSNAELKGTNNIINLIFYFQFSYIPFFNFMLYIHTLFSYVQPSWKSSRFEEAKDVLPYRPPFQPSSQPSAHHTN